MKNHNAQAKNHPLTKHGDRGWYKWLNGKSRYICSAKLSADDAARFWYQNENAIRARIQRPTMVQVRPGDLTLRDLVNKTLVSRRADVDSGNLTADHFADIAAMCKLMLETIQDDRLANSLRPDDFVELSTILAGRSKTGQRKGARILNAIFSHAYEEEWIDHEIRPGRRIRKMTQARVPVRRKPIYTADECQRILAAIDDRIATYAKSRPDLARTWRQLRCLTLLGLNGGLGMKELADLRCGDFIRSRGLIEVIRVKKDTWHVVPLWPETLAALEPFVEGRKATDVIFKTRKGEPLVRSKLKKMKAVNFSGPDQTFDKVLVELGIKRPNHGFYLLKHTHRSESGSAGDETAADIVAGHAPKGMRGVYQNVSDERLKRVTDHVRAWLFNPPSTPQPGPAPIPAAETADGAH